MTMFELYLLTRFETLSKLFEVGAVLSAVFGVATLASIAFAIDSGEEKWIKISVKATKAFCIILIVSVFGSVAVPSNKALAIMFAGSWATQSSETKKVPDKAMKVLNKFMDEYLEDNSEKK